MEEKYSYLGKVWVLPLMNKILLNGIGVAAFPFGKFIDKFLTHMMGLIS